AIQTGVCCPLWPAGDRRASPAHRGPAGAGAGRPPVRARPRLVLPPAQGGTAGPGLPRTGARGLDQRAAAGPGPDPPPNSNPGTAPGSARPPPGQGASPGQLETPGRVAVPPAARVALPP